MSLTDLAQHAEDQLMRRQSSHVPTGGGVPEAPQTPLGQGHSDRPSYLRSQSHSPTLHRRAAVRPNGPGPVQGTSPPRPENKVRSRSAGAIWVISDQRLQAAADHVVRYLDSHGDKPLPEAAQRIVSMGFMRKEHLLATTAVCQFMRIAVTFRLAGQATQRVLAFGGPTKGPEVEAHTIKLETLAEGHPDDAEMLMRLLEEAELDGYVGHWDEENGRLLGLLMGPGIDTLANPADGHPADARLQTLDQALRPIDSHPYRYYPVDLGAPGDDEAQRRQKLARSLETLRSVDEAGHPPHGWRSLPFRGDYDTHETLIKEGRWIMASDGTGAEAKIAFVLNMAMAIADPLRRAGSGRPEDPQSIVRHGPQSNYKANKLSHDRRARLHPKLMQLSLPLAACEEGKWRIIRTKDQWRTFYTTRGLVPKEPPPSSTATPRQARPGPDARPPRDPPSGPGHESSQRRPVRPTATDPRRAASVPAPLGRAGPQGAPPAIVVKPPAISFKDPFSPRRPHSGQPPAAPLPDDQAPDEQAS